MSLRLCCPVKLERDCRQTPCPFNQLNFAARGASSHAAVHLQRSKQLAILGNNAFRTESIQTTKLNLTGHYGKIVRIVPRQGNERKHVATLAVESTADFIQDSGQRLAG